jgi:(p)ppGpp synthase/HD superfamily hydrolase
MSYVKERIALRYWLIGRGYHEAGEAMKLAAQYHVKTRKDGVTPEFAHQVAISHYLRTLEGSLLYPEKTIVVALLHDIREDYDLDDHVIRVPFGDMVADSVDRVTKEFRGVRRNDEELFVRIGEDPIASIVKLGDRINNQDTMLGVFPLEKMTSYMDETERLFLPMLKRARRNFPRQEAAYENAKQQLESQFRLYRAFVAAGGA